MSSKSATNSPKFRNLCLKHKQSPKELKDKMRKNYKETVKNCRSILLDKFRGPVIEEDICTTLTEIYKSMFKHNEEIENDEVEVLEELKSELVQEELEWWLGEYERSQMDNVDWSTIEEDKNVICPLCQKSNFQLRSCIISCPNCKFNTKTQKSLSETKIFIMTCVEIHNSTCSNECQFIMISEGSEAHIYLVCNTCTEMTMIL